MPCNNPAQHALLEADTLTCIKAGKELLAGIEFENKRRARRDRDYAERNNPSS